MAISYAFDFVEKRIFVLLIITIFGCGLVHAQNRSLLLRMNLNEFRVFIESAPQFVHKETWELFYEEAELFFKEKDFNTARNLSEKALVVADKLEDDFLRYVNHRQIGEIRFINGDSYRANRHFRWATNYLKRSAIKSPIIARAKTPGDAYLLYYWGSIFSELPHSDLRFDFAIKKFGDAHFLTRNEFSEDFDDVYSRTALEIGKVFGEKGHQLAKYLWLNEAKRRFPGKTDANHELFFQIHYESFNSLHYLGNYFLAQKQIQEIDSIKGLLRPTSELQYLHAKVIFNGSINRVQRKHLFINKGIHLARLEKNLEYLVSFYRMKMLQLFLDGDINESKKFLRLLEDIKSKESLAVSDVVLKTANALFSDFEGKAGTSIKYFEEAERIWEANGKNPVEGRFLFGWSIETLFHRKDYSKLKVFAEKYLELVEKDNVKNSLPFVYINLSQASLGLGDTNEAIRFNQKAISLIEEKRKSDSANVSAGVFEHLFQAYQLEMILNLQKNQVAGAFLSSDKLKGRWLNDKISGNRLAESIIIDSRTKEKIFNLTLKILVNPKNRKLFDSLSFLERNALRSRSNNSEAITVTGTDREFVSGLETSTINVGIATVSYAFTEEGKLVAFLWTRDTGLVVKNLEVDLEELSADTETIQTKIKNRVFFKRDGKELYDKLIKPLNIDAKHLIIIPDKALWKIPFQALSPDGKKYLIEDTKISYAPSVSILLKQLKNPKPDRKSFQVFSNATYNKRYLKFADVEAKRLAKLYGVQPTLNSSETTFVDNSAKSDINHFSMHAEVNKDEPFNSFLAFKPVSKNDGKLTVDELLKMKVKKGSLAFLASCDTNNVFNGEGLVSLSWGMMAAGASTVVYTQWEANDESTGRFTEAFYKHYRKGASAAEAIQKASIEMINDKSSNMNEPYYWAEFVLTGDYR